MSSFKTILQKGFDKNKIPFFQPIDKENHNQEYLRFGATTLYDKNKCKQEYKDYPDLLATIDKYMICSLEPGHLNDHGVPYTMNQKKNQILRTGCITQRQRLMGLQGALVSNL